MADIHVNGRTYPLVSVNDMNLDEARIVYEYTNMSTDEIGDVEGLHPGLIAALIHIAVQRGEPQETAKQIRQVVGKIPLSSLNQVFEDISAEVPDGDPPQAAWPSNGSGGASSTSSEPGPDDITQVSTGSPGLDTGATWPRTTSAR